MKNINLKPGVTFGLTLESDLFTCIILEKVAHGYTVQNVRTGAESFVPSWMILHWVGAGLINTESFGFRMPEHTDEDIANLLTQAGISCTNKCLIKDLEGAMPPPNLQKQSVLSKIWDWFCTEIEKRPLKDISFF
jgi:hypothetical protein